MQKWIKILIFFTIKSRNRVKKHNIFFTIFMQIYLSTSNDRCDQSSGGNFIPQSGGNSYIPSLCFDAFIY